jgi:hypothetical protein
VLVLVTVLTTVLIKYVVLTGSYKQNSRFDYHMNDDLGRMVLNPDVNVRSCNGEMFYVYSNDASNYS